MARLAAHREADRFAVVLAGRPVELWNTQGEQVDSLELDFELTSREPRLSPSGRTVFLKDLGEGLRDGCLDSGWRMCPCA